MPLWQREEIQEVLRQVNGEEKRVTSAMGQKEAGEFFIPGFMFSGISAAITEGEERDLALF